MFLRITQYAGLLAFGLALGGCTDTGSTAAASPPEHAKLDTGTSQTGNGGTPATGGAAAVGSTPSGAITTPTQ